MGDSAPTKTAGTPSWQTGALNGANFDPQVFNKAMGADIQNTYLKGPVQTQFAGLGDTTKTGIQGLLNVANNNAGGLTAANDFNTGVLSSGGINPTQSTSVAGLQDVAGNYGKMFSQAGAGNPNLDNIIKSTNDNTYADVMASLGAQGRTGSSVHMNELGTALANNESRLRYQDSQDAFNRQNAALTGQGGAYSGLFNMGQTGTSNAMTAANNAPAMFRNLTMPAQFQMQAGGLLDANNQAAAQFDPTFQHLAKYQGLLSGQSGNPQPQQQPGFFDWAKLIGGILAASV